MARSIAEREAGRTPAEVYEERFVPALFGPWGRALAEIAEIGRGQRVLDVACGTGALTCAVASRVGPEGRVVGLDPNPDMLSVARRKPAKVEWCEGRAEELPFADESFDHVVSQFGLMFFDDRVRALGEMLRVLARGGHLTVAVCGALQSSPGYAALAAALEELFGAAVARAFEAPFALGDREVLLHACAEAKLPSAQVMERSERVRFSSIEDLVATERACVWTLGGLLDDAQFARLLSRAKDALAPFEGPDGRVTFEMPALIISAYKP